MRIAKKLTVLFLLFTSVVSAQEPVLTNVSWQVNALRISNNQYQLTFQAVKLNGWEVYAPNQVLLETSTTTLQFSDSAIIQNGVFKNSVSPRKVESPIFGNVVELFSDTFSFSTDITVNGDVPGVLPGTLYYTYGKGNEFYPSTQFDFSVTLEGGKQAQNIKVATIDIAHPVIPCGDEGTKNKSVLNIFLLGFLGGLIAFLTPCVFPMVPVTVTFFTRKSGDRKKGVSNAVLYGVFIFLIYVLITLPFHIAGNAISPEIFNNISTNVWLNIFFFAVFVFFALSFFGLFEIGLPSGLANKADERSGISKVGGIFFMAATLAIVSFSCTGPILGTLLVGVADQGAWPLTAGAAGFGIALGLPFALFAMFPHWLQSLPKSGGWMTDVKVVLGFLEIALAIKFLSNADLVKQWGLLKREVFIGLWVLIGLAMVLYLLGMIRIGHSGRVRKFSAPRVLFILLFGSITGYLAVGLFFPQSNSLKFISGFPPPRTYSLFKTDKSNFQPMHNDYAGALVRAKAENKPVLIDFTGWACVNCRKMEEKIWPDPVVDSLLRREFVVVSLYVDERKNLPLGEQTVQRLSNGSDKSIVTVGDKWSTFQTENFGATAQPQYAIISYDEKALTLTKYFTEDADAFAEWLNCGLRAHREYISNKKPH